MLIELQNFGPIKSFQFDTSKDIHAIFGKNNIGKSYAISAVYLILKNLSEYSYYDNINFLNENLFFYQFAYAETKDKDTKAIQQKLRKLEEKTDLENAIDKKLNNLDFQEYSINEEVLEYFQNSLNLSFLPNITNSFKNTFEFTTIQNFTSQKPLCITITSKIGILKIGLSETKQQIKILNLELFPKFEVSNADFHKSPIILEKSYTFFRDKKTGVTMGLNSLIASLHKNFKEEFLDSPNQIYFLPASRSGLYNALNSFGAIFAELSRNRNFIRQKIEIPNISEPISDYFLKLNTIDKAQVNEKYVEYFEEIEKDILKGTITLDTETKKYFYTPQHSEIKLELSFTSSMISEIAPIIAHLKYIIPFGDKSTSILFIEEPEAHLHPEVQVALLNFFVKLSKANVKIVMTSHSNYIFNKLSNLIIAKEIQPENISISLMKMTNQGSVIEDGAMAVDEYGIEDNNFVDIAEQLYEERMQLLEKL